MRWVGLAFFIALMLFYVCDWVIPATVETIPTINRGVDVALLLIIGHITFDHLWHK